MNFYLGVWNSPTAISDDEAAARYRELSDETSVEPEFDTSVYNFYCRLISLFPDKMPVGLTAGAAEEQRTKKWRRPLPSLLDRGEDPVPCAKPNCWLLDVSCQSH